MRHLQHDAEHLGNVIEPLQAFPQGLGAGLSVAFAPEKAAEGGDAAHGLAQGGLLGVVGDGAGTHLTQRRL